MRPGKSRGKGDKGEGEREREKVCVHDKRGRGEGKGERPKCLGNIGESFWGKVIPAPDCQVQHRGQGMTAIHPL